MGLSILGQGVPTRASLSNLNRRSGRKGCLCYNVTVLLVLFCSLCGLTFKVKIISSPRNIRGISDKILRESKQGEPLYKVLEGSVGKTESLDEAEEKLEEHPKTPDDSQDNRIVQDNDGERIIEDDIYQDGEFQDGKPTSSVAEIIEEILPDGGRGKNKRRPLQGDTVTTSEEEPDKGERTLLAKVKKPKRRALVAPQVDEIDASPLVLTFPPTLASTKQKAGVQDKKTSEGHDNSDPPKSENGKKFGMDSKATFVSSSTSKTILLYTTLFGNLRWPDLDDKQILDYPRRANCPYHESCKITYDKEALSYADAVVFHGVDLFYREEYVLNKLAAVSESRPRYQRWVFFMHESPYHFKNALLYNDVFNWTMTYERGADIFLPYCHYQARNAAERQSVGSKNYAAEKSKLVALVANDCAPLVVDYIRALRKRIDISVYGNCAKSLGLTPENCNSEPGGCDSALRKFKFFIAFERVFCKDYITSIFWEPLLKYESVPITLGANYDTVIVPSHSFVDAGQFPSVKALADYLLYLDKSDEAYNGYFKWKRKYRLNGYDKICQLCNKLHQPNLRVQSHQDIWSRERSCQVFDAKVDRIRKIIQEDKDDV